MNPTPEKTSVMAPFILMLFLYFIVGLFTVINQQFQVPLKSALLPHDGNMTNALVTLLNFSWFLAYPFSEGFATRWVDRLGYRKTSVYSLLIFIAGLGFYEAAVLLHIYAPSYITIMGNPIFTGFFVFLSGSFVIGMAVTILQVVTGLYLDGRKNDSAATANDRRYDQFHRYGYRPAGGQLYHILRYSSPQHTIP